MLLRVVAFLTALIVAVNFFIRIVEVWKKNQSNIAVKDHGAQGGIKEVASLFRRGIISRQIIANQFWLLWYRIGFLCLIIYEMAQNAILKILMFLLALAYISVSSEGNGFTDLAKSKSRRVCPKSSRVTNVKTVIFIRHGESVWNFAFNRGFDFWFLYRFVCFLASEFFLFFDRDSVLFDSPLSTFGISQSVSLQRWLADSSVTDLPNNTESTNSSPSDNSTHDGVEKSYEMHVAPGSPSDDCLDVRRVQQEVARILKNDNCINEQSSVIVTSNLRRALSTALILFKDRLLKSEKETVVMHSGLQEATKNADGLSLAKKNDVPVMSQAERNLPALQLADFYGHRVNPLHNAGNKPLLATVVTRIENFSNWIFDCSEIKGDTLVVVGHSAWFRSFFQRYIPLDCKHVAKEKKIVNCGIIHFKFAQLKAENGQTDYWVDPETIMPIYGGYK